MGRYEKQMVLEMTSRRWGRVEAGKRKHSEFGGPEASGMESGLGNRLPATPRAERPLLEGIRRSGARLSERLPTPAEHTSSSPPPGRDTAVHPLYLLLFSLVSLPLPGKSLQAGSLAGPAASRWVPASITPISTRPPHVRARPLRGPLPAKATLTPSIPQQQWPCRPWLITLPWGSRAVPSKGETRGSPAGRGEAGTLGGVAPR